MHELVNTALAIFISIFGLAVVLYAVGIIKTSPGRILGHMMRGTLRGSWWLTKVFFITSLELVVGLVKGAPSTGPDPAYGTASFLKGRERRRLLNRTRKHNGLLIDGRKKRLTAEASYMHCAVTAGSGKGKSTRFVIPNILTLEHSMISLDPSGELWGSCGGYLASKGFRTTVISVSDVAHSLRFNPLSRATSQGDLRQIANILLTTAYSDKRGDNSFWNDGAKTLLVSLLAALKNDDPQYQNLPNLKRLVDSFGSDGKPLNSFIARNADETTLAEYKSFISQPEKIRLGMVATARVALEPFSDPEICALMSTDTVEFESLRKEKSALFISVPEHQIPLYRFFLVLLYAQLFSFAMIKPQPHEQSLFFLLDEFGHGAIPGFSSLITSLRKRRVSISILLQSESQLEKTYGRNDANTILTGGIASRLYLPGQDIATCTALEKTLGKHGVTIEEESGRRRDVSRSLLTADEIRTMDDDEALFIHSNQRPVLLRTTPYFKNRNLLKRTRIPAPPLPESEMSTELHYVPLGGKGEGERNRPEAKMRYPKPPHEDEGGTFPPPRDATEARETTNSDQPLSGPSQVSARPTSEPISTPPWAALVEESRRAREEVEILREAIGVQTITRKEAARILGVSTKTLQRWEKAGRIRPVEVSAPGIHYTRDSILRLRQERS